jgi:hypothetical protein
MICVSLVTSGRHNRVGLDRGLVAEAPERAQMLLKSSCAIAPVENHLQAVPVGEGRRISLGRLARRANVGD